MAFSTLFRYLMICFLVFLPIPAWSSGQVVIADFSLGLDARGVPLGWQLKERTGRADFSLTEEGDIHALHLRSMDNSFGFQKALDLDPRRYPLLTWKWKVTKLPEGGDFRRGEVDDQAAQIFLGFSNRCAIVYIWDSTAPQGLMDHAWAPPFMTIKAIVVRSGPAQTGRWITEARNVVEDYKRLFGDEPPPLAGVRIQINSQHTETSGESFIADLVLQKEAAGLDTAFGIMPSQERLWDWD